MSRVFVASVFAAVVSAAVVFVIAVFAAVVLFTVVIVSPATAQYRENDELHADHGSFGGDRKSPNRAAETLLGDSKITIEWSAPSVRDREIFGPLIPSEKIWRTGANEASVIHFDDDVIIEGEALSAGNYALFTIGSPENFTFIFNSISQQWGAFSYAEEEDALRITVATHTDEHQEEMLFSFQNTTASSTDAYLNWGTISTTFSVRLAASE